jgi:CheY-like chemotaxis protein
MYILIVDSDPDDVELFCEAVLQASPTMGCIFSKNGKMAFNLLETSTEKPKIIFTDIDMPEMDGIELIECLKKHQSFKCIPIVVYTASKFVIKFNRMVPIKEKSLELGASHFVSKPVTFDEIVDVVKSTLEAHKIEDQ